MASSSSINIRIDTIVRFTEGGHVFTKGQFIPSEDNEYKGSDRIKVRVKGKEFLEDLKKFSAFSAFSAFSSWGIVCRHPVDGS